MNVKGIIKIHLNNNKELLKELTYNPKLCLWESDILIVQSASIVEVYEKLEHKLIETYKDFKYAELELKLVIERKNK